jgi:nucleotide-binding universal stress UspA family protein
VVEFKQILCPVDLSEFSVRPLAYAGAIARWYRGRLIALHVVPTFEPFQVRTGPIGDHIEFVFPPQRDEVQEALRELVECAGIPASDVTLAAEEGEAGPTILDQAVKLHADLLVMGTHGRSGFDRLLLGSVTEKVLRKAPCPVLTVPPHAPATTVTAVRFKKILCPMDFSPSAMQAFGFALDLARQADGSLIVIQAIEWLAEEEPRGLAHFNVAEYRQHLVNQAHERLAELITQQERTPREIDHIVVIGRAYREILRVAEEKSADLIVMGAQGRGGAGLALFGSTTQQVVRAASCPVLTVRGPAAIAS